MSEFWDGFLTGFANNMADQIGQRRQRSEEYFEQQMHLARTRGLQNKQKIDATMNASLSSARQLIAMGAPEHLVKGIANQNPDDIPDIAAKLAQLQADGVNTDKEFFENWIQVHGDFAENKEDLGTFFKRIYSPLSRNINADPDTYKKDKRGTWWATALGYDAMERSMDRLDNTVIADGMTAGDLLALDPNAIQHPLGENVPVTLDYTLEGDATREAKASRVDTDLSITELDRVKTTFDEEVEEATKKWVRENKASPKGNPEAEAEINTTAAMKTVELYGEEIVSQVAPISRWLVEQPEMEEEEVPQPQVIEKAPDQPATPPKERPLARPETSPEPQTPAPIENEAAQAVNDAVENMLPGFLPSGERLVKTLPDGTSLWVDVSGKQKRYKNSDIQKMMGY